MAATGTTVVFGAGGGTGLECVKRLLQVGNGKIRAVVRNPETYTSTLPNDPRVEMVKGDVTDPDSCVQALVGAAGVIFAASAKTYWGPADVDFKGVQNVANAAKEVGARVVLVSSMLVTPHNRFNPMRLMLNNMRYSLMDNKYKGEQALRAAGISYTIVRPGGLTDQPGGASKLIVGQGDKSLQGSRAIARADVAAVCVDALRNPHAERVTLEVVGVPFEDGQAVDVGAQLEGLWQHLRRDEPWSGAW